MKQIGIFFLILAVVCIIGAAGCSHPVYTKRIETSYDANGNETGRIETEVITQTDPIASSLKVNITKPIDK